jgi:hypothetical protein
VEIVHGAVMVGAAAVQSPAMLIIHVSMESATIPVQQLRNEGFFMLGLRITDRKRCVTATKQDYLTLRRVNLVPVSHSILALLGFFMHST